MADVNDMFNEITKEQSFYNPKQKKEFTPLTNGEYLGHITEVDSQIVNIARGNHRARLYTFSIEVDKENKSMKYTYEDINGDKKDTDGMPYIGKLFRGKLWRFIEPTEGDEFTSNSGGNDAFLRFCETIGIKCPKETKSIDGQDIEVQLLPNLASEDMLGRPVTAVVSLGKPWKDKKGNTRQYYECKFCKKWEKGKRKTITQGGSSDIPF